jgi:EAL domain-containing protein (putative c-di-GMP-specific phosphodiesterase class I)
MQTEMIIPIHDEKIRNSAAEKSCGQCRSGAQLDLEFEFAFQPIVNVRTRSIYAHEALVRGPKGESAYSVISRINERNRYQFDQACRVKAVRTAAQLGMKELLSINFMPNAVYEPAACIRSTFEAAKTYGFPTSRIIFEVTEGERVDDRPHLVNIFESYKRFGFLTAIDDFGAGYAGLNLLAEYQPHIVKLDMELIRGIDQSPPKQAIVRGVIHICASVGSLVLAEGIETRAERDWLANAGIELMQGYHFCRPAFQALGVISPEAWL